MDQRAERDRVGADAAAAHFVEQLQCVVFRVAATEEACADEDVVGAGVRGDGELAGTRGELGE